MDEECFVNEDEKCLVNEDEKCFVNEDEKCCVNEDEKCVNEDEKLITCTLCENTSFKRPCDLASHMKWKHKHSKSYQCTVCNETFTVRNKLVLHKQLHPKHGGKEKYKEERIVFDSFPEFSKWKEETEAQTKSLFVKTRGTKRKKDHTLLTYYCHRSGKYKPRGENKRSLKKKGSNKINSKCPAKMSVQCYENRVLVSFVKTHVGHTMDLNKLTLSKKEKDMIAEKIAMKIPLDDILDSITDSLFEENSSRLHLITRRDLLNIRNKYNLKNVSEVLNETNINVKEWIKRIQESSSIIRLYKPQGQMLDNYPQLDINDFLLIITNDTQLKLLSTFGNDCLCINRTDGVDDKDFRLYTILVLDELQEAIPCSFLITNRDDTVAMEVYFSVLLTCLPSPISPKYFMSDVTESFYNAWCSVTGGDKNSVPCQLYSSWHVDQHWRNALSEIDDKEKQIEVYKNLKVIMHEPDVSSFNTMAENFMTELYSDISTQSFAEYLERNFYDSSFWSYCFRLNEGVNTNMSLENMHTILKHVYVQRKVQRLDKCVKALMQFSRERLYDRFIKLNKADASHKLTDVKIKHKESLSLSYDQIQNVSGTWLVPSTRNANDFYEVVPADTHCTCNLKCDDCGICVHYFRCTCFDATIKWNMCKHIHLVGRIMLAEQVDTQSLTNFTDIDEVIIKLDEKSFGNDAKYNSAVESKYNAVVESEEYNVVLEPEEYNAVVESEEYNAVVESKEYNAVVESEEYNAVVESEEYNAVVESEEYNAVVESGEYNAIVESKEYNAVVESEVIIEELSEKDTVIEYTVVEDAVAEYTVEDLNKRKILFIEKILGITNLVESLDELEALEEIMAPAEQIITTIKMNRLLQ